MMKVPVLWFMVLDSYRLRGNVYIYFTLSENSDDADGMIKFEIYNGYQLSTRASG